MPRGGARKGAGRPKGLGKYGEKTLSMRIPLSKVDYVAEIVNKGLYEIPYITVSKRSKPVHLPIFLREMP